MENTRGIPAKGMLLAAAWGIFFFLFCESAPAQERPRDEESGVAVRTSPEETMGVRFFSNSQLTRPELPYSLADESRGRWLMLFEAPFRSVGTQDLPETWAEEEN